MDRLSTNQRTEVRGTVSALTAEVFLRPSPPLLKSHPQPWSVFLVQNPDVFIQLRSNLLNACMNLMPPTFAIL